MSAPQATHQQPLLDLGLSTPPCVRDRTLPMGADGEVNILESDMDASELSCQYPPQD